MSTELDTPIQHESGERTPQEQTRHRRSFWDEHDRDRYYCPGCGTLATDTEAAFHVHHIDGDASNGDRENLIALCKSCHDRRHERARIYHKLREMRFEATQLGDS